MSTPQTITTTKLKTILLELLSERFWERKKRLTMDIIIGVKLWTLSLVSEDRNIVMLQLSS